MFPDVSIIIVNYFSGKDLVECIKSIRQHTHSVSYEIILVDNSPEDRLYLEEGESFGDVIYLTISLNQGFARANNAGIKIAKGKYVLLLNPDTLLMSDAVGYCAGQLDCLPGYAACGVQLLFPDFSPQVSGNNNMIGGLNYLMTIPYAGRVLRAISLAAGVKRPSHAVIYNKTDVDWINGAFIFVRKSAIEVSGLLDPDFFLYHEESEWCGRLQKEGKLCVFGEINVIHFEGKSSNKVFRSVSKAYSDLSDKKGYQLMISMLVRIRKQFGASWFLLHMFSHLFFSLLVIPISILHGLLNPMHFGKIIKSASGYFINVMKTAGYIPRVLADRPYFYKVL